MTKTQWYKVAVHFSDFTHYDSIRGTSPQNALANAYTNWEHPTLREIELVK